MLTRVSAALLALLLVAQPARASTPLSPSYQETIGTEITSPLTESDRLATEVLNEPTVHESIYYNGRYGGSLMGHRKVAESHRLAGGVFNGNLLDPNYDTTVSADGTVAVTGGEAVVSVAATSNSAAYLTTKGLARYTGSITNYYRAPVRVSNLGSANNVRAWGASDSSALTNGYWFRLSGTDFQIVVVNSGSATVVDSEDFNGVSDFELDTNYNVYEIYYTSREIVFVANGLVLHTYTITDEPAITTRHLRPFLYNKNTGVGSVVDIRSMVMTITALGNPETQPFNVHIAGATAGQLIKTGPGTLRQVGINSSSNASRVVLYDGTSTSGSVIADIKLNVSAPPVPYPIKWEFISGLFVVTEGSTTDISLNYD